MNYSGINPNKPTMHFNVIVTFDIKEHIYEALQYNEECAEQAGYFVSGSQVIFDAAMNIYTTSSYDSLMRRLKRQVVQDMTVWFGLNKRDIVKISTAATWKQWEQLTGEEYRKAAANSNVSTDGKFYMHGQYGRAA